MEVQECKGVHGEPGARPTKLGDLEEPKNKWLQRLQKQREKSRVQVQTRNFEVRVRKRAIEKAGGLGGIVAGVHT